MIGNIGGNGLMAFAHLDKFIIHTGNNIHTLPLFVLPVLLS